MVNKLQNSHGSIVACESSNTPQHFLRVSPIQTIFDLSPPNSAAKARVAVANVAIDDSGESTRTAARNRCDELLHQLADSMGISPAREIRRIDGEAPSLVLFDSSNRVNVSFAHSDNWVVVGLSLDIAIGVDIQSHRVLARRAEISELLKFEPGAKTSDEEFFACWALREAVAKATSGSVLSPHPSEAELAATCLQGNKIMSVGSMTALVDEVAGAHLAVVINADAALKQCAWQ